MGREALLYGLTDLLKIDFIGRGAFFVYEFLNLFRRLAWILEVAGATYNIKSPFCTLRNKGQSYGRYPLRSGTNSTALIDGQLRRSSSTVVGRHFWVSRSILDPLQLGSSGNCIE